MLESGGSLAPSQTSRATDLDEVLNMVDGPTGTALSMLLTTLGQGILGNGDNADRAVRALAPALQDTDRLAQILEGQNSLLQDLLDSVAPVLDELATGNGEQFDRLIDATETTLAATAREDAALGSTLARLPAALREARITLAALAGAAGSTAPVLAALRPTTDNLVQLGKELEEFSDSAAPALDSLDPVLTKADLLLERARPVARSLSGLSRDLRATARSGRVLGTAALDNLTTILDFVKFWSLTTNGQDGLSHYFRAHLVVTADALTGVLPVDDVTRDPDPTDEVGTGGEDSPLDGLLNELIDPLGGLLGSKGAQTGSATGLTSSQERGLLSYLTGGN